MKFNFFYFVNDGIIMVKSQNMKGNYYIYIDFIIVLNFISI